MIYNFLYDIIISRAFASKGKSACEFSLIFWGRTENSDGKIALYWKFVSTASEFSRETLTWQLRIHTGNMYLSCALDISVDTTWIYCHTGDALLLFIQFYIVWKFFFITYASCIKPILIEFLQSLYFFDTWIQTDNATVSNSLLVNNLYFSFGVM